jgi:PadR family transcriptional regulator PadR
MKGQALKGHLDLLLLAVLSDGAKHGYAVIEELKLRSDEAFNLPAGTVYPALHRLEKAGYLASDWSVVQGRRRRTYRLTDKGRRALGEERRTWGEFSSAVSGVLKGVPWPSTP